jgi:hypothetical protein
LANKIRRGVLHTRTNTLTAFTARDSHEKGDIMATGNRLDQMSVCSLFVILRPQVQPSTVSLKIQIKLYVTLETNLEGMSPAEFLNVTQERLKSDIKNRYGTFPEECKTGQIFHSKCGQNVDG